MEVLVFEHGSLPLTTAKPQFYNHWTTYRLPARRHTIPFVFLGFLLTGSLLCVELVEEDRVGQLLPDE